MHTWPFELLSQCIFMHCMESPFLPSAAPQHDSVSRRMQGKKDYRVDVQTTKAKPCRVFQSERKNSDLIPCAVALFPQQPLLQRYKPDVCRCILCVEKKQSGHSSIPLRTTLKLLCRLLGKSVQCHSVTFKGCVFWVERKNKCTHTEKDSERETQRRREERDRAKERERARERKSQLLNV